MASRRPELSATLSRMSMASGTGGQRKRNRRRQDDGVGRRPRSGHFPRGGRLPGDRIVRTRSVPVAKITTLIEQHAERPWLGFFGEPRVNVLRLNLALDALS
jgi:hypothetical protein